ncbi:MAG: DNA polymerase IV, partial [Anaerolineae bacterium]|nr:DNA polymerase IV [Anaerolineae bacterium]
LKLRLADFTTFTRQATLARPTDAAEVILAEASRLLARELQAGRRFRLLGVGVSNFRQVEAERQRSL